MLTRVALDTNRLTDLMRGDITLAEHLELCGEVWIPFVVLAEIKAGFHGGSQCERNEAILRKLLGKATFEVLLATLRTPEHYARIFAQLKRAGTPIPDNDLWIAALAIEHDLVLITRDRHFENIPQLLRA